MRGSGAVAWRRWSGAAIALGGLAAVIFLTLAPSLAAGFEYDDRSDVLDNAAARPESFFTALGTTNRPLVKASYAAQRLATGDAPRPFHALNIALHLACALLVFCWLRRLLEARAAAHRDLAAWSATALWALHPAAVEAVAPIVGRSTLLATLLGLGAVLLVTAQPPPSRTAASAAGALACGAVLARETALVLPALTLLWQATLGAGEPRGATWRRQVPVVAGAGAGALALALSSRHRELIEFSLDARSPLAALRGNLRAIPELLGMWIVPARVSVDPPQPADASWLEPAVLASAGLLLGLAAMVVALRRRRPRVAFAVGWLLLALAPSNSIVWRLDPVAPRALYLASLGLVALVALAASGLATTAATTPRRWRPAVAAAAMAALVAWPAAAGARESRRRAALWAEPSALWADAAAKAPDKARPWLNLGVELMLAGRFEAAEAALERASRLDPTTSNARCALDALRIRRAGFDRQKRSDS